MIEPENYEELPCGEGDELYSDLDQYNESKMIETNQPIIFPTSPPPIVSQTSPAMPFPNGSAPALPNRNKMVPNLASSTPISSTYNTRSSSPMSNKQTRYYGVPSIASPKGPEDTRVLQAYQKLIQAKKAKVSKVNTSLAWAKRPDQSGEPPEYLTLAGLGPNIPFTPPCILVKMQPGTEACTGNYMRLFVPPLAQGQNAPTKGNVSLIHSTFNAPITQTTPSSRILQDIPSTFATEPTDGDEFYDDTLNMCKPQENAPSTVNQTSLPPVPYNANTTDPVINADTAANSTDTTSSIHQEPAQHKAEISNTNATSASNVRQEAEQTSSEPVAEVPKEEVAIPTEYAELLYDDILLEGNNTSAVNSKPLDTASTGTGASEDSSHVPQSPAPSLNSDVVKSKKEEATDKKKSQQAQKKRVDRKKASMKQFKSLGVKLEAPVISEVRAIKPNPKGKDMLTILENEVVNVLMKRNSKMPSENWLVEKQDGSVGYADITIFNTDTAGEIYEIF